MSRYTEGTATLRKAGRARVTDAAGVDDQGDEGSAVDKSTLTSALNVRDMLTASIQLRKIMRTIHPTAAVRRLKN